MDKFFKFSLIPIVYNLLGIILFYNQDLLIVLFNSIATVIFHLMINEKKSWLVNYLELNIVMLILFAIAALLGDSDKILILKYISLLTLSFSIVYLLKKKQFNLT